MSHERSGGKYDHYDLLGKTELTIFPIDLDGANLNEIADVVSGVLGLDRGDAWVVDVRDRSLTIDILRDRIDAHAIAGKQSKLLARLGRLPGVAISPETNVSSRGMLGWIADDTAEMQEALDRSEQMAFQVLARMKKRAVIFSTGQEVASGNIEDTNMPLIAETLIAEGYSVTVGGVLPDDRAIIAGRIRQAITDEGFGLIITTGGVGAEDKDHTVEAVLSLDSQATTPYLTRYEIGKGRHVKDGVRIAVGEHNGSLIVALPGPNDEVVVCLAVLAPALSQGIDKSRLAEAIARRLRERLHERDAGVSEIR